MIGLKWKLILAAGIALIIGGLLWKDHITSKKLATEKAARILAENRIAEFEIAEKIDTEVAKEIAAFKDEQRGSLKRFENKLASAKLTTEVQHETASGEIVSCFNRNRSEYRRLHNEAVNGATNP